MPTIDDLYNALVRDSGVAQGGDNYHITLAATAPTDFNIFKGGTVAIVGGTGKGQSRTIIHYSKLVARRCRIDRKWQINPDSTSQYVVLREHSQAAWLMCSAEVTVADQFDRLTLDLGDADFFSPSIGNYTGQLLQLPIGEGSGEGQVRMIRMVRGAADGSGVEFFVSTNLIEAGLPGSEVTMIAIGPANVEMWRLGQKPPANLFTGNVQGGFVQSQATLANEHDPIVFTGVAQAGGSNWIQLAQTAPAVSDQLIDMNVRVLGGTGAWQTGRINAYDGPTRTATINKNWAIQPAAGSSYAVAYP